jgi:hypothetical protein
MWTTYTFWYWYGEKHARSPAADSNLNRPATDTAGGSKEQGGDMHSMVRDVFGMHEVREENCEAEVVVQRGEEIVNEEASY